LLLCVVDKSYSDLATFKSAMSGVYLEYELATPTLTPLKTTPSALTYAKDGYKALTLSNVREAGDYHLESVEEVANESVNKFILSSTIENDYTEYAYVSNGKIYAKGKNNTSQFENYRNGYVYIHNFNATKGKTYTFSFKIEILDDPNAIGDKFLCFFGAGNNVYFSNANLTKKDNGYYEFTALCKNDLTNGLIEVRLGAREVVISEIQVEEGTERTSFKRGSNFSSKTELYADSGKTKPIFLNGTDYVRFGKGKNLFNKDDETLLDADISASKGTIVNAGNSLYMVTDYISINESSLAYLNLYGAICFFDSDKKYISGSNIINNNPEQGVLEVSNNAKFIRFSVRKEHLDDCMLVEGSTAPTEFEPYCEKAMLHREYGEMTLDGTENWSAYSTVANHFQITVSNIKQDTLDKETSDVTCNYDYEDKKYKGTFYSSENYAVLIADVQRIRFKDRDCSTLKEWTDKLKAFASMGKPLKIVYPLATPTNESVDLDPPITCPNVETTCSSRGVIEAEWWEAE